MAQYVLAPSNVGRNHRAGCVNTEIKTRAASRTLVSTAPCLCSSPAPKGPGLHSRMRVRALDKLAEKIQKRELHKFTFSSCFIVVKRTGSAQFWEHSWVQGSDRLQEVQLPELPWVPAGLVFQQHLISHGIIITWLCLFGFRMKQALKSLAHMGFFFIQSFKPSL